MPDQLPLPEKNRKFHTDADDKFLLVWKNQNSDTKEKLAEHSLATDHRSQKYSALGASDASQFKLEP